MKTLDVARAYMDAVNKGDEEAARAVLSPNAEIWHNFDNVTQTVDQNMKLMAWMVRQSKTREYEVTHLEEIEGGYLQQHVLRMTNATGDKIEMPACVIVKVVGGKITRIEEYLDPAPARKLRS